MCPLRRQYSLCVGFLPDMAGGEQSHIYLSWKNKEDVRLLKLKYLEVDRHGFQLVLGILPQTPSEDHRASRSLSPLKNHHFCPGVDEGTRQLASTQ